VSIESEIAQLNFGAHRIPLRPSAHFCEPVTLGRCRNGELGSRFSKPAASSFPGISQFRRTRWRAEMLRQLNQQLAALTFLSAQILVLLHWFGTVLPDRQTTT